MVPLNFWVLCIIMPIILWQGKNRNTLTRDISNHNIKCVFASKGTQYVCFNPNISDKIKVSSQVEKMHLTNILIFDKFAKNECV